VSGFTLDDLAAGGIGDSLRVGPQWIKPSNRGLPVIQRGPHGQTLSPPLSREDGQLRWWRENVSSQPYVPQQKVVGIMGMGGSDVAHHDTKIELTKAAKVLVEQSLSLPTTALPGVLAAATTMNARLDTFQHWDREYFFTRFKWAEDSQVIRSNFQLARQNATRRMQGRPPQGGGAVKTVDLTDETVRNMAAKGPSGIVRDSVDAYERFSRDQASKQKTEGRKLILGLVTVGILGVGVYAYFSSKGRGPTIQFGS
jgi:hypothetical protein